MSRQRTWTIVEGRRAAALRWEGMSYAEIGAELGRTRNSVAFWLQREGKTRTRPQVEREVMLRRAWPMQREGVTLSTIAQAVGWPATVQALHQALKNYQRRLGPRDRHGRIPGAK